MIFVRYIFKQSAQIHECFSEILCDDKILAQPVRGVVS